MCTFSYVAYLLYMVRIVSEMYLFCSPFVKKLINKFDFEALDTKIQKSKVVISTKISE